jgi:glycerol-3-phosphate dehydrogenase
LEYGEFSLVRESLAERNRLLRLAPQFVRPLELVIPVSRRTGGWLPSVSRFLLKRSLGKTTERGLWLVRMGLWMYDRYARDPRLPRHSVAAVGQAGSPPVDPRRYRWLCSYWDAQIVYPERFVLALLEDARAVAESNGIDFEVFTYHEARWDGRRLEIRPVGAEQAEPVRVVEPAAVVNATGAWVDRTLQRLQVASPRLIGGTQGSHFLTFHPGLRQAMGDQGLYAEADDGRPVFVLPLADGVLVGTTDIPFDGDPTEAQASDEELDYLLDHVRRLMPHIPVTRDDIDLHYAGVRPLPFTGGALPSSITRRHWMQAHSDSSVPLYSIIGGKLTTCRSLAEEAADTILKRIDRERVAHSRERPIPGAESHPTDAHALDRQWADLARQFGLRKEAVQQVWSLVGSRSGSILAESAADLGVCLEGTTVPVSVARWMIRHEWVTTLDDVVERRLMLLYQPDLSKECLNQLAGLLAAAGKLPVSEVQRHAEATAQRLHRHFGKRLRHC